MKITILTMAFVAMSLTAISCSKDDGDTTKPSINLSTPAHDQVLKIGDLAGVLLEMDLSDDVMLGSYKLEVHSNADHHEHSLKSEGNTDFSFHKEYDISGNKSIHISHNDIVIPVGVTEGEYHLMVYCTDAAGTETQVARDIILRN